MLDQIKRDVLAGKRFVEATWTVLKLAEWGPDITDQEAIDKLAQWSLDNGIEVEFSKRKWMAGSMVVWVTYVLFTNRRP